MKRAVLLVAALAIMGCKPATNDQDAGPVPDLAGNWLPDAQRAEPWPASLPLTEQGRARLQAFDPVGGDPTQFCMPFGTPRNMLQTGHPLEIVQTPDRIVMILQPPLANAEVRRIPLDGTALPEAPEPSWYGTSRGHWEGATLVVETIGLREDAILGDDGLAHSGQLRVVERLRLVNDAERGSVLVNDIELVDPASWQGTLKTRREYTGAAALRAEDSHCVDALWTRRIWEERLKEHAAAAKAGKVRP